jgi:uncharacterized protein (DUF433 family)
MKKLKNLPKKDPRIAKPIFTLQETADYLAVPYTTLRSWARPEGSSAPLITVFPSDGVQATIPFIGFAEAFVVVALKEAGVPAHRIRPGIDALRKDLGVAHALASHFIYTDGAEFLIKHAAEETDLEVARIRQKQLTATVRDQLRLIEYAGDGYAERVRLPIFRDAEVIVDPKRAFGLPLLVHGGARIEDILSRYWAGDSMKAIAADFEVPFDEVEEVIRVSTSPRQAARGRARVLS